MSILVRQQLPTGVVMCLISLTAWYLTVCKEIVRRLVWPRTNATGGTQVVSHHGCERASESCPQQISATALTRAIWAKPITDDTVIERLDNGKFMIKSLSAIRFYGAISVCLVRLGVAYVMLCCGTFFLACAPRIAPSACPCVAKQLYALACPPRPFSRALSMV